MSITQHQTLVRLSLTPIWQQHLYLIVLTLLSLASYFYFIVQPLLLHAQQQRQQQYQYTQDIEHLFYRIKKHNKAIHQYKQKAAEIIYTTTNSLSYTPLALQLIEQMPAEQLQAIIPITIPASVAPQFNVKMTLPYEDLNARLNQLANLTGRYLFSKLQLTTVQHTEQISLELVISTETDHES